MDRKGFIKFGFFSLVFLLCVILLMFIFPVSADVDPGQLQGYNFCGGNPCPIWVNLTKGDMFFANGNDVYIIANISCAAPPGENICNASMTVDANFSQIGISQLVPGVFKENATDGSWAVFEFNSTVNLTNIQQIQPKNVTLNATIFNATADEYGTYDLPSFVATVLLVNMSTFGCPPADTGPQFPIVRGWNISSGSPVAPTQAVGCTQNTTLCANMDLYGPGTWDDVANQWKICAPTFGGQTTNLTAIAATGNFSAIPNFTIEVPGKGKIVFQTNVSFSSQQESQAIMEFAMKSAMTGGRIGINDTEFNGQNNRPNLTLTARLTIYNVSGQTGIIGKPQIFKTNYGGGNLQGCGAFCSNIVWDGENLTFTVTSFSTYQVTDAINVTLSTPGNNEWVNSRTVNFNYTPVWNSSITMSNCTLFGNFTDPVWAANNTNSTTMLVNGSVNNITNTVGADGVYAWNVECYDVTGLGDTGASNYTVKVDTAYPVYSDNTSELVTVYSPSAYSNFSINWAEINIAGRYLENNFSGTLTNSTMSGTYPDYYYNSTPLPAGPYQYRFVANDSFGNANATPVLYFTIAKATPAGSSSSPTVTYPTSLTATGTETNNGDADVVYQEWCGSGTAYDQLMGQATGGNPSGSFQFGAGSYNCKLNTTSATFANWTSSAQIGTSAATVNQNASNPVRLFLNATENDYTYVYPQATNATGAAVYTSSGTVNLWRNESPVSNPDLITLVNGTYLYKANITGNDNYSSNDTGVTYYAFVNKGAITVSLYLNGTATNVTSVYPNSSINTTAVSSVSGLYVRLWRNGTLINNGTSFVINNTQWAAYPNNFTAQVLGNDNYSDSSPVTLWWNVSKGNPYSYLNLYIDGNNSNKTVSYPSIANASANFSSTGYTDCNFTLWRNDSIMVNGSDVYNYTRLGNAIYLFKYNITETCTNWTANSTTLYLLVSKGTPSLSLTASSWAVTYPATSTVTCSATSQNDEVVVGFFRDGTNVTSTENNVATSLSAGTYNYTCNSSATGNYSSSATSQTLTVSTAATTNTGGSTGGTTSSTSSTPYVRIAKGNTNITVTSLTTSGKMMVAIAKYEDNAIRAMNLTVLNNVANIKLVILKLASLPSTVSYDVSGKVYHYISIEKSNITDSDINSVSIRFAVNKSWLSNNNVVNSNITLYRWSNSRWNDLNATKVSEDSYEVFYQVSSPGLSVFVIGAKGGITATPVTPTCAESWSCTDWSACVGNQQTKTCTDANSCGTSVNKPIESQSCEVQQEQVTAPQPLTVSILTTAIIIVSVTFLAVLIFLQRARITSFLQGTLKSKSKRHSSTSYLEGLAVEIEDEEESDKQFK